MNLLAIDPGNEQSAFVVVNDKYEILNFGKVINHDIIVTLKINQVNNVVIEGIASYGMAVGADIFETCEYIGRFTQVALDCGKNVEKIYRKEVKLNLCGTTRAKDSNISQALKDRFGDKGTKASPGWFFGFKSDCWSAYAVAVTYLDKMKGIHNA